MKDAPLKVLGFAGSLRRASYNRGLLRAAQEVAPEDVEIEVVTLDAIPPFNQDVEAAGDPPPVREFKARIRAADALLIATPEYNYSIPGVLKNAIDWAARPAAETVLRGKPVALLGASVGFAGTVRAQLALRQVLVFTGSLALLPPEVLVANAMQKFDADGNLIDADTRPRVRELLEALAEWTRLLRAGSRARAAT